MVGVFYMKYVRTAVLLAAGFGTRLRPLTNTCAKPALPFFNQTLLHHLIDRLAAAGIERVFINIHYMGDSIVNAFTKKPAENVAVEFSPETEILGTAGVLGPLYRFLKNEIFVMINGDIVTNIDIRDMIDTHCNSSYRLATVALHTESADMGYPQAGASENNILTRFPYGVLKNGSAAWYGTFAGVHIIEPDIFRYIQRNSFQCINSDIYPRIMADAIPIGVYRHNGYWNDIGNPHRYFKAHQDVLSAGLISGVKQCSKSASWIHETAKIGRGTVIQDSVFLYPNTVVNDNATLKCVIVWPGTSIEANTCRHDGILINNGIFHPIPKRNTS
jgi:NDP-sugar pyrophosphorylase family protein